MDLDYSLNIYSIQPVTTLHKKSADLVTFTEEILNEKLYPRDYYVGVG